jgi:hypothetical protein
MRKSLRAIALLLVLGGCDTSTSKLSAAQAARFQSEGIKRQADNVVFRYTRDPGGRDERREDRRASIIVTGATVLIHKNEKLGIEITPRARRDLAVERSGSRIRIRSGRGRSEEIWSFEPPDDAAGWAADIRNVMNATIGVRRGSGS